MDFSSFKKISSTPHLTVLKHPSGHEIRIAHAGLGENMIKKLKEIPMHLAEGSDAPLESSQAPMPDTPEQIAADAALNPPQEAAPQESVPHAIGSYLKEIAAPAGEFVGKALKGTPLNIAKEAVSGLMGGEEGVVQPKATSGKSSQPQLANYSLAPQGSSSAPTESVPQYQSPYQAQADAARKEAESIRKLEDHYQGHINAIDSMRKELQTQIANQKINPNDYFEHMGAEQKITTALGLILGGFGAGATGGRNVAVDYLNKQVENNIQGQMADLGKKQNLLSQLTQQFGNVQDAAQMMRAMQNDYYAAQLQQAATQIQDPLKRAQMLQTLSQFQNQGNAAAHQVAMRQGAQTAAQSGGMDPTIMIRAMIPDPKDQEHYFKELQSAQNMVSQRDNLMSIFDELSHINTLSHTAAHPIDTYSANQRAKAFLAALSKETEGRVTEADVAFLNGLLPARGVSSQENAKRRMAAYHYISQKMHFPLLDSIGANPAANVARFQAKPNVNVRQSTGQINSPLQVSYQGQGQ